MFKGDWGFSLCCSTLLLRVAVCLLRRNKEDAGTMGYKMKLVLVGSTASHRKCLIIMLCGYYYNMLFVTATAFLVSLFWQLVGSGSVYRGKRVEWIYVRLCLWC